MSLATYVSIGIGEHWQKDLDVRAATFADVGCQGAESHMGIDNLIGNVR
jgi:hypothetical protein